jgi:mRNA-degrading endonuclease RelE of RelBE toxin-antitoxin system
MVYVINYEENITDVFGSLEPQEREFLLNKLYNVARAEFREPWEWDYKTIKTHAADGRLRVGDDLRVFMNIDRNQQVLGVYEAGRRENLY